MLKRVSHKAIFFINPKIRIVGNPRLLVYIKIVLFGNVVATYYENLDKEGRTGMS